MIKMMSRMQMSPQEAFLWLNAQEPVLLVGCRPEEYGRFLIQAEAAHLPLPVAARVPWPHADDRFDTVLLGHELSLYNARAIAQEALRVARRRVVFRSTIADEAIIRQVWLDCDLELGRLADGSWGGVVRKPQAVQLYDNQEIASPPVQYSFPPLRVVLPKVSVLLCTYRPGGLDVTLPCLGQQDYAGEWEIVMVDELYAQRRDVVSYAAMTQIAEARVRHLSNPRSIFPQCSTVYARNEAIVAASGDIVIFLTDYAVVRPDWITQHVALHLAHGNQNTVVNGAFYNVWPPRLADGLRAPLDPADPALAQRTTLFDHDLTPEEAWQLPLQNRTHVDGLWSRAHNGQDEASTRFPEGWAGYEYFFMKHDSLYRDRLVEIGGLEEDFAGMHRYDDSDLGLRLYGAGCRFYHSKRPQMRIVQVRHLMRHLGQSPNSERVGYARLQETVQHVTQGDYRARSTHEGLR